MRGINAALPQIPLHVIENKPAKDDLTGFISNDDDVYMLEDDTVTFNTQCMDIEVGYDVEKAERGDTPYVLSSLL